MSTLPDEAYATALAGLDGMGPRRLGRLLRAHSPSDGWNALAGHVPLELHLSEGFGAALLAQWQASIRSIDVAAVWAGCVDAGIEVLLPWSSGFPEPLALDPVPPAVLFARGDLRALDRRRVGVVGTRNPTRVGADIARDLGGELAAAGVAVVSGLARGIDGAAHRGVVDRPDGIPIAVVGNGPDRPYPRSNAALWEQVVERGLVLSEWPPGTPPDAFRFPLRNRILAALSEVLVVVESRETGGSLLTVREAADRSVTVMAVPGSTRNRAANGTNGLIAAGAVPVCSVDDVLVALGLDTRRTVAGFDPRPAPDALGEAVLRRCRDGGCTLDDVVEDLGLGLAEAAMALARLERAGWIDDSGGWFEARGSWSVLP
jgi:DNA processing protein